MSLASLWPGGKLHGRTSCRQSAHKLVWQHWMVTVGAIFANEFAPAGRKERLVDVSWLENTGKQTKTTNQVKSVLGFGQIALVRIELDDLMNRFPG